MEYQKFLDTLQDAIEDALDNGTPARLSAGGIKHSITIDIYESKAQMRIFNETILSAVKEARGIKVVE